ncbi:PREDICTED: NADH dehydrogenase [ubiquinone] 1 beta subcomplex subunit 2, mitochondrial-like [Vollenhovia emeryi]|uniref:NADH dehydrogenase [ubiquinone] 1 beta subcomplex subunit 2, mitochondrial-like n=1 Tax=Vollenhovia emeryi TaxID=411798 RepID=UPI0005F4B88E|nr:PREDICTED: NADH dehydrogenase [ubiquinone] 1 beta subcomplex subunit 2, mitochondrial-like [Vollenhovia emeryi]XP_011870689.1 PREDICTED: NADH dehydrogenase [ubiquinone] 1 beta subcomplex subunit 2, mitochondrial-like [Vollenhovia emeryi]XP_011870690.1 PREDICTED: NADH dehydrogenase [ubiquinone] 1 beta subcomplex subunit 2, mitochondrial-like [Vollenhovia emeryi]
MIITRGLNLLKIVHRSRNTAAATNLRPVRLTHGPGGNYRDLPPENKQWTLAAEVFGGFMWWWILWHFWHDWGHIVGEFDYPDPSKWTDEELGIPPDDYPVPATRVL